jgi:hypothetical protein
MTSDGMIRMKRTRVMRFSQGRLSGTWTDRKQPSLDNGIVVKKTICSICNVFSHCGIDAHIKNGIVVKVEGTKEHPHSGGTLCSKGAAVASISITRTAFELRCAERAHGVPGSLSPYPGKKRSIWLQNVYSPSSKMSVRSRLLSSRDIRNG